MSVESESAATGSSFVWPQASWRIGVPCGSQLIGQSSLIFEAAGPARLGLVDSIGIDFGSYDPLAKLEALLGAVGLKHPDEIRGHVTIPAQRLMAIRPMGKRRIGTGGRMEAIYSAPEVILSVRAYEDSALAILRQALILSLTGDSYYDPERPPIWTAETVQRQFYLCDSGGFYK